MKFNSRNLQQNRRGSKETVVLLMIFFPGRDYNGGKKSHFSTWKNMQE